MLRLFGGSQDVVGLSLHAGGGDGITMNPVADLYVSDVAIDAFFTGIQLSTLDNGTMTLDNTTLAASDSSAVGISWVVTSQAEQLTLTNTTVGAATPLLLDASSQADVSLIADGVELDGARPLDVVVSAGAEVDLEFVDADVLATEDLMAIGVDGGGNLDLRFVDSTLSSQGHWLNAADSSGGVLVTVRDSTLDAVAGGEAIGLGSSLHVTLDNVTASTPTTNNFDWLRVEQSSASLGLVVRDTQVEGGSLLRTFNGADRTVRVLLDNTTVTDGDDGLSIQGSSGGSFDVDIHASTFEIDQRLVAISAGEGWIGTVRAREVEVDGGGFSFQHYGTSETHYFLDHVTVTNANEGVDFLHSSSGGDATLEVRRSRFDGNGRGLSVQAYQGSSTRITYSKSEITGSTFDGVRISGEGGPNRIRFEACAILDNASGYTVPNARDIDLAPWGSSFALDLVARDTWFGTTDLGQLRANTRGVIDTGTDTGMDSGFDTSDTGGLSGVNTDIDPVGPTISFLAHPPYGTPSGGEVLLRVPFDPNLIDRTGDEPAVVMFGGQSAEVLSGSASGDAIRVRRPPLLPGTYDVTIADPIGRSGTLLQQYTVDPTDPDTVSMLHQSFVRDAGTWFRVTGPPNGNGRLFLSREGAGPRACPLSLGGTCLQIPEPVAVEKAFRFSSTGVGWVRVNRPPAADHPDWVSAQVVALDTNGQRSVSPPETWRWLDGGADADGDGLDNRGEHDEGTDPYQDDHDGDGCIDGRDVRPREAAAGTSAFGLPTDCQWYP